ncbi:BZ3500_MvSof-1268-A1-R1_Chr1-1g01175 [Microbotryum saponariae]|uniref:BZ3500_MvSof-1268-A1-R1_Chr1-1g01175 protein n=1 Tax=Microbotryum saponariae TaxID=289078 RepID=A0A2X0KNM0_9BASI|nr:BZ3500_MvSof-1268-A1-R1_Chr1-1g01175 [Microbotryum saponariae]SCZ93578.1 BZ3501_MvSof-1269-A2-R1_Chr1-1g00771 [Microbotryum saponariae]
MRYETSLIRIARRPQAQAQGLKPQASRARESTTSTVIESKAVNSMCALAQIKGIHLLPSAFIGKYRPTIDRIDKLSECSGSASNLASIRPLSP